MFDQIDIDWEYPGGGGLEGNSESSDDGKNYALLIKELRMALDNKGMSNKKIAIAAGAPTDKLDASNLKALIDNGLDSIHLMSYDFMGEWQTRLAHQTNLSGSLSYVGENGEEFNSAENAINYMIDVLQIPANKIHIGYANYSRNAGNANINSVSPLVGTFTPGLSNNDSYEEGVSELFDYEGKVVDYSDSGVSGLQGYEVYTDTDANADFLFNAQNKQFLSIETPRSTYAKARFARQNNLGGVFTWMADHDPGYHLNAARVGLGYNTTNTVLDMSTLVNDCGYTDLNHTTLTPMQCNRITNNGAVLLSTPEQVKQLNQEMSQLLSEGHLTVEIPEEAEAFNPMYDLVRLGNPAPGLKITIKNKSSGLIRLFGGGNTAPGVISAGQTKTIGTTEGSRHRRYWDYY